MDKLNLLEDDLPITEEIKATVSPLVFEALTYFNRCDRTYRWLIIHSTPNRARPETLGELIQFFTQDEKDDVLGIKVDDMKWEVEENT